MSKLLSIIIPVYNVEKYIQACIDSIIPQINKYVEVIFINDGTLDKSIEILEKTLEKLSTEARAAFTILEQNNQGQSVARNEAINIASGEYISFVDSDDILSKDYISEISNIIGSYRPDIIVNKGKKFLDNSNSNFELIDEICVSEKSGFYNLDYDLKVEVYNKHNWYIWLYVIKKSIINDNRFVENVYFEDAIFVSNLINFSENIFFMENSNYFYRLNSSGSLLSVSPKNIEKNIKSFEYLINFFYKKINENEIYSISYVISFQSYLSYVKDKKGKVEMLKAYYIFLDKNNKVKLNMLRNKGNLLFYKYGVFFLIFLIFFRR